MILSHNPPLLSSPSNKIIISSNKLDASDIFKIMIIKAAIKYSKVGMCVCYYYVVYRNDSLVEDMMNSMKSFFLIFLLLTVTILGLIFSLRKIVIWRLNLTILCIILNIFFSPPAYNPLTEASTPLLHCRPPFY